MYGLRLMYLIFMKLKVIQFLLTWLVLLSMQVEARFPEFGFCPLGGPPGWFNRLSGQSHRYYPPPIAYPQPDPVRPFYTYPVYPNTQVPPFAMPRMYSGAIKR
jgi:hypothetical protein